MKINTKKTGTIWVKDEIEQGELFKDDQQIHMDQLAPEGLECLEANGPFTA